MATRIAEGELEQTFHHSSNDELDELAENFDRTVVQIRDYAGYIDEISERLQEIARGNLDFTHSHEYVGEQECEKTGGTILKYCSAGSI